MRSSVRVTPRADRLLKQHFRAPLLMFNVSDCNTKLLRRKMDEKVADMTCSFWFTSISKMAHSSGI